jgi:hypothetical protein
MPSGPHECRRQAYECIRLAQLATTHQLREDFAALANTWLTLAVIFEKDDKVLRQCARSNVISFKRGRQHQIRLKAKAS